MAFSTRSTTAQKTSKADPTLTQPDLSAIGLKAFEDLTAVYLPPKPSTKDSRHTYNEETEGVKKGLYHFAYWQQNGHNWERATQYDLARGAALSKDAFPSLHKYGLSKAGGIVPMFFQHIAPVTQAIGSLFETIDPVNYKRYRERSLELNASTPLRLFTASQLACFLGNPCLVGLEAELHRDIRDTEDKWGSGYCFWRTLLEGTWRSLN